MNKTAIKNFAIWARNKLIADIRYKASLMGITSEKINNPLSQSTRETEFYDIGTSEPYAISGDAIKQRRSLVDILEQKTKETNYKTAYKYVIEEVAYTWFNRLIAIRFMEVNDYLPSHVRVLSSESGKIEPDVVSTPFDAELSLKENEKQKIIRLKNENKLDECFLMLFIKQCNELNRYLPALFEKTADYSELLLNVSMIDKEGVVYHLVNDISEDDFNIEKGGQVEIIGWLYQYYNTDPKNEAFAKNGKITKEEIPAVTQLFTPDWIVRYMVENSLGRLWVEGHPNDLLKSKWKYYLEEAEQEPDVQAKLEDIHKEYSKLNPEDIHFIDPCMGSGHILVYAFDVLMHIYESVGYSQRDAAKSILENNLYGLDIDDRAYQMAYFAVMMKARQYNRRIFDENSVCRVYSIQDSNSINRNQLTYFGAGLSEFEKNDALNQITGLLDVFRDAKEYGSILNVENYNWNLLRRFAENADVEGQMSFDAVGLPQTQESLKLLIDIGETMARKYEVVVTNPPYFNSASMSLPLTQYIKRNYEDYKTDLYSVFMYKNMVSTVKYGFVGMITQQAWMFLNYFEKLRENVLCYDILNMEHLGARAFAEIGGEVVQTTAFVLRKSDIEDYVSKYYRLTSFNSENQKQVYCKNDKYLYLSAKTKYMYLPGKAIAYWITETTRDIFKDSPMLKSVAEPRAGLQTGENELFLRLWEEVRNSDIGLGCEDARQSVESQKKWFLYSKGGGYRKWFGNYDYVVDWYNDGENIKRDKLEKLEKGLIFASNSKPKNVQYYFREGVTWSTLSSSSFAARQHIKGAIFDIKGSTCFFLDSSIEKYSLGLMNSKPFDQMLQIISPTLDFNAGYIGKVPIKIVDEKKQQVESIVEVCIKIAKKDWDSLENSIEFIINPLSGGQTMGRLISDKYKEWEVECDNRFNQLKANEEELNRIFIDIYGLQDELTPEVEDKDVTVRKADLQRDIKSLISYAVGCMFGRYSLDVEGLAYAGGDWDASKYSTFIPDKDNIIPITDEEYFEDDILGLFCGWLKKVYGADTLEQNLDFIATALGNKGSTSREIIRNYFVNDFFKDHCQTYSVTGSGKRPIYWLFDSGKQNGFKALIYLHRYNADTVGNLRVDYLHRMQRVYESEIGRMQDTIDHSTNSREVGTATKRKEKLQKQLKECRDYDEKIGHLALARIEIDLDDGVKVNYRKLQTGADGKFYEVLSDSKNIMSKEK